MRTLRASVFLVLVTIVRAHASDWLPISPDDLKMTSEPKAPRAPAIYLYRQVDRMDNGPDEDVYERIKILTDEGKSRGNLQITYLDNRESITGLEARTIRPDGTIVKFEGKATDQVLAKGQGTKYFAKTLTLPDVQVGSIIEYRYRRRMDARWVFNSHWILSADLFTKSAKFTLEPADGFAIKWSWPIGLPPGTDIPKRDGGRIKLTTHDVPAFVSEDYAPPEDLLKFRVDFDYSDQTDVDKDLEGFWKKYAKKSAREVERFVDQKSAMTKALAQIVSPTDLPSTKVEKIYARVQQLRNLSFEREMTDQEEKRQKLKAMDDVEDVWNRGYGNAGQINLLFVGLVRAAGINAHCVEVSTRDQYFFQRELMNPAQLNTSIVAVGLDGREVYVDPGTKFAPMGVLPWNETGVSGLLLEKDGGVWITTPTPSALESRIERSADVELTDDGSVEGTVRLTFYGMQALTRRISERNEDAAARKKSLEDQVKRYIPLGADVELKNNPNWDGSSTSLMAEFKVKVPGWAMEAGRRRILAASLFSGRDNEVFEHATRVHPVYFSFPYQLADDVTMRLPKNLKVENLPKPLDKHSAAYAYSLSAEGKGEGLRMKRELSINTLLVKVEFYDQLRAFFQDVKTGDESQIILASASTGTH